MDHLFLSAQWPGYLDFCRTTVTLPTTTANAGQHNRTESVLESSQYNSVPMRSPSNSDSISSLICKVVLSSSASSGRELHLFTSKQSHCLPFFYPLLFHARAVKEMYSNSPGLWSFPPNLGARLIQSSLLSFLPVWKHIREADPSLRMLIYRSFSNFCDICEWVCTHTSLFFALVFVKWWHPLILFWLSSPE